MIWVLSVTVWACYRWVGEVRGMDPVTPIVTVLAAGAATALQDGVSSAVKEACAVDCLGGETVCR
jgi:hypothetical protein